MRNVLVFTVVVLIAYGAAAQTKVDTLLVKANAGDVAAQIQLAKAYQFGEGVAKNMTESVRWYYAAAAKGNGEAAFILGTLAYNGDVLGENVRQSDVQAWIWFDAADVGGYPNAAEARDRTGQDLIDAKLRQAHETAAALFLYGGRFPANSAAAIRELEWLDENTATGATVFLANQYIEGKRIPKDLEKAKALCEKADKKGYAGANYCLGRIQSESGDSLAAFNLIKKDAELAYPAAMLDLANRYRDGNGTKADPIAAYTWALRCDAIKSPGCTELKEQLALTLREGDRKKAQKEAAKMRLPGGAPIMDALKRPAIVQRTKN